MKKIYITLLACASVFAPAMAQTVSTFENIALATDTFWNGSDWSGGFASGNATFVNHYDTAFGFASWEGFAVSNKRDSVTAGFGNQYSAVTAKGYNASSNYAVAYMGMRKPRIKLTGVAAGKQVAGFAITNSTYGYYAMKNGSSFNKKFGGATGADPDFFKVIVRGFKALTGPLPSVEVYLADFRSADSTKDYIVKDWRWVDLLSLGNQDSLEFELVSSDTVGGFMNNPAYFCMDIFTTRDIRMGVAEQPVVSASVSVYPNPAHGIVMISGISGATRITITDLSGKEVLAKEISASTAISLTDLAKGIYVLRAEDERGVQMKKLAVE